MKPLVFAFVFLLFLPTAASAAGDGLVRKESAYSVTETIDRLQSALESKGLTIFARIDHAAGAAGAGLELRPATVLVFGNPKLGTPLMQSAPTVALDLPQKALAYEDAEGTVYLVYNDPAWLAARHGIGDRDDVLATVTKALDAFSDAATM